MVNGKLLVAIRTKGFRQRSLSRKTGIAESTLSLLVSGRLTPTPTQRAKVAKALEMSEGDLFPVNGARQ